MSEENKKLICHWFEEVWNNKNADAIGEMLTDETVHHGLGAVDKVDIRGVDNFKEFHRAFLEAFPDLHVEVLDCITEGDKVAIRCVVKGTHRGGGLGIAQTNSEIEFTGSGICTVKDGKFVEVWNEFDFMRMYHQIGALTLNL